MGLDFWALILGFAGMIVFGKEEESLNVQARNKNQHTSHFKTYHLVHSLPFSFLSLLEIVRGLQALPSEKKKISSETRVLGSTCDFFGKQYRLDRKFYI